ncbi:MAG: PAS domain S-box protein [Motiliproteus sp.]
MLEPLIPDNEATRLCALRSLNVLDTQAEERFDRYTRLARQILQTPIVLISLIDAERQWFKSRQGLEATETPRAFSFCGHAILTDELFCVADTAADPRFADNPLVTGAPDIRFYAGAPLVLSGGERVGTLCAIDIVPRTLSAEQRVALLDLARCVVDELQIRSTQRILADREEQLQRSSELVRSIIDTVVDGIITIDASANILTVNLAAVRLFGYRAQDMVGKNVKMLMPEPFQGAHDGYLRNYLNTGDKKIIGIGREVLGLRQDGGTFPMELSVGEMAVKGQRMFTGIVRDITERKRMEQMKNEFVSTVSHELRTPLTSIKGALGLIRSGVTGALPEKLRGMLDIAYNNSDRLVRLINDILDIEKIEAGKMDFHMTPLDLVPLIEESLEVNQLYAKEHGVSYRFDSALATAQLQADHDRLMQVLTNLLSNAAKFSPEGGCVVIGLAQVDNRFRIEVHDQGSGIPAAFRDKVFAKFSQADGSDSRLKGGTGLGLNISQAIVKRLGGQIGFDTEEDVGTTFYVELPCSNAVASAEPVLDTHSGLPAARILVCEDDPAIAAVLRQILTEAYFVVDLATSSQEALIKLRQRDYAAMTLHLRLPDQDGAEVLQLLRCQSRNADIPVIVASVLSDAEAGAADASVVSPMQPKPIDTQRLIAMLRKALQPHGSDKPRILHVEDDADVCQVVATLLKGRVEVTPAPTFAAAQSLLDQQLFDLVLLDLMLPDGSGEKLLARLPLTRNANTPVVIFSARELLGHRIPAVRSELLKSKTDNDRLLTTIIGALRPRQEARHADQNLTTQSTDETWE